MRVFTPGQRVTIVDKLTDPFSDPPNQPVDDNTETITIWRPNGTVFSPTPTPTHPNVGEYRFAFLLPSATPYPDSTLYGTWSFQTSASGAAQGNSDVEAFEVVPTPQ